MKFGREKNTDVNSDANPQEPSSQAKKIKEPRPKKEKPSRAARAPSAGDGKPKKSSGRKSFVLLIGDEGAILIFMQGTTVLRRLFAASPQIDHTVTFAELMKTNPGVPVTVLVDVVDQQYVRHTFPPVSQLSINGLVNRRIERDFQAEYMTGALSLGRDTAGRKEWQYLIISLANTPLMQDWLEFILELPNHFTGAYLLPVEMQHVIPLLSKGKNTGEKLPWQFLITHHKVSGFRQVVLFEGKLVFTRVSQAMEDAIPAVISGNIEQEIISTLEYLRRLNFKENDELEIYVIAAQEVVDSLDLKRFEAGAAYAMTPLEAAEVLNLEQAALSADRFGDVVVTAAFSRQRKHVLKFSNAYANTLSKLYTARLGVRIAAALIAAALLFMSASSILDMLDARSGAQEAEDKKQKLQPQIEAAKKLVDGLNKDTAYKVLIVSAYDTYLKDATLPDDFVGELSPLLPADMRVKTFQWGLPAALSGAAPAPAAGAAKPPDSSAGLEIHVGIELTGKYDKIDALTKSTDQFIATLKTKMPEYDITADPYPWAGQAQAAQQISLDKPIEQAVPLGDEHNKIMLTFRGPKKIVAAGKPAAPPVATPEGAL